MVMTVSSNTIESTYWILYRTHPKLQLHWRPAFYTILQTLYIQGFLLLRPKGMYNMDVSTNSNGSAMLKKTSFSKV